MTAAHESGTHDDGREARGHGETGDDRETRGGREEHEGRDGHESRDGHEGPDGREGHEGRGGRGGHDGRGGDDPSGLPGGVDGMDPLMAAILDVPPAEDARTDPLLAARHRAAAADVALLREQLAVLADALTRPPAAEPARRPAPVPFRPSRRRLLPLVLKTAGLAAAGALVAGSGWLLVQVNGGADDIAASSGADKPAADEKAAASGAAGGPLGDPGYLACARLVAEGDVTEVVPVHGTSRRRVTLRVTRSYVPGTTARGEVGLVVERDVDPLVAEGDHVLVGIPAGSDSPDVWAVGEAEIAAGRSALARALPGADGASCE
ncbi:hypothetical protein ACF09K_06190 [Streptomyces sp. NPDC014882]|uniref:hypothetical protein n=1 Tax=Streptomyces sp. NPDC014882 TaxID=3364927 RepID=UPI0036F7FDF5